MIWSGVIFATAVSLSLLALLGLPPALALRLRGLWLSAAIAPLAFATIAVAAALAPRIGLGWSVWPAMGVSVVASAALAGLVLALRRLPLLGRSTHEEAPAPMSMRGQLRSALPTVIAILIAATIIGWRTLTSIGNPEYFAQEYDNVFHLNAVRHVLEAGDASPNGVVQFSVPGASAIYPSVWHAFNALVIQLTDVSIATASNATFLTISCLVWPLSILALTRAGFGRSSSMVIAAGALSAGVATFPLFLITDIGAYPLVLSISILPVALACVVTLIPSRSRGLSPVSAIPLFFGVVLGVVASHPSSMHALAFLSLPVGVVLAVRWSRRHPRWRVAGFAALAAYVLLVILLSLVVRPMFQGNPTIGSIPEGIFGAALLGIADLPTAPLVALLAIVGAIAAFRTRDPREVSMAGMWAVSLGLYVIAAGGDEFTRSIFTGGWYRDPMRLAALAAVMIVPLATRGAGEAWRWIRARVQNWRPALIPAVGALMAVGLVLGTQGAAMRTVTELTASSFTPAEESEGVPVPLGADARVLIGRVPDIVPEGDVIAGDPRDGSSFTYALVGRRVLLPHLLTPRTPEITALLDGLATAGPDDPACEAVRNLDLKWVLLTRDRTPDDLERGLYELEESANTELVDSEGGARLYRIVGCGG